MQVVNIPTMMQMIHHAGVRKHRPLFFWGASGIGKSEAVHQSAAEHDATLVDIRVSQYESVDFRGIPDTSAGLTVWHMPSTLPFKGNPRFEDNGKPIYLFLDEINQGDPSVLSVLYQLINDRRVGEHVLMDNVVIIAAGNREIDRGTTGKWPAPLGNRGSHAELVPDVKPWSVWAQSKGYDHRLVGFLNFRAPLLHTFDPAKPVKVFATPRSWSYAHEDFVDDTIPTDVKLALMSGSVGEGPVTELFEFVSLIDAIRPIEEIIADPDNVPFEKKLDVQWALATHIAGNMTKDNATPLHRFLTRLEDEMVVMAWTLAINRDADICDTNAFLMDYAPRYRKLFQS